MGLIYLYLLEGPDAGKRANVHVCSLYPKLHVALHSSHVAFSVMTP